MDKVKWLKSDVTIKVDDLGNVWYKSDVDVVLGRITGEGKFIQTPNRDMSSNLLRTVADIMDNIENSSNNTLNVTKD